MEKINLSNIGVTLRNYSDNNYGELRTTQYIHVEEGSPLEEDCKNLSITEIEKMLEDGKKKENDIIESILKNAFNEWALQCAKNRVYEKTIEFKSLSKEIQERETTLNKWKQTSENLWNCSNQTYSFYVRVYENTDYNRELKKSVVTCYELNWGINTNSPLSQGIKHIAGQERKKFKVEEKEKMIKYIEGRIKKYSYLFQEEFPKVPKDLEYCFSLNGKLLDGYTLEN